jgi:hypothetical protein
MAMVKKWPADLQRKVDEFRHSHAFETDPEVQLLQSCRSFAEKALVVHGLYGMRGVATYLRYSRKDKRQLREAVNELRKAGDPVSRDIASIAEYLIKSASRHVPTNWKKLNK